MEYLRQRLPLRVTHTCGYPDPPCNAHTLVEAAPMRISPTGLCSGKFTYARWQQQSEIGPAIGDAKPLFSTAAAGATGD